jgi:hypothetical protein
MYWPTATCRTAPALAIILLMLNSPALGQSDGGLQAILADHYGRFPLMELEDLYKLVHQAAMGSEHAVSDTAAARAWLDRETENLGQGPPDPEIDPLAPDSSIVRVHLRPYLMGGGNPEELLSAFLETANLFAGSETRLRRYWGFAADMAIAGELPFDADEMAAYFARLDSSGFPAVHHSASYEEAYRPAYRVVALRYLPPELRP